VCQFVFENGGIPLNPFRAFDYYLGDRVDRELVREANRSVLKACDEVWVFGGELADGVLIELSIAASLRKPLRFYSIGPSVDRISPLSSIDLDVEQEVIRDSGMPRSRILERVANGNVHLVVEALGRSRELRVV
jgi:hypothetical protein